MAGDVQCRKAHDTMGLEDRINLPSNGHAFEGKRECQGTLIYIFIEEFN